MIEPVKVTRVEVRSDRIVLLLQWADDADRDTSQPLVDIVLRRYPDLPRHRCVNEKGNRLEAVLCTTPLPHLLEHMILSEMTRDEATAATLRFCGTSQWIDEAAGLARLELSFHDDIVALRSIRTALEVLNEAMETSSEKISR